MPVFKKGTGIGHLPLAGASTSSVQKKNIVVQEHFAKMCTVFWSFVTLFSHRFGPFAGHLRVSWDHFGACCVYLDGDPVFVHTFSGGGTA